MFYINTLPAEYIEPWAVSLENRLNSLYSSDRRIAYFYEKPDCSTFRYRVYNMIQTIQDMDGISATYFCLEEINYLHSILDSINVLVICRARYTISLNSLIARAKNKGVKVLFDLDDLVFNTQKIDLILHTLDQDFNQEGVWDHWFAYIGRIGALLKLCDGCITTNTYLGDQVKEYHDIKTMTIPNFLNQEQLAISNKILKEKLESHFQRTDTIYIGYFSGTPTHNKDFAIVVESLIKLLEQDKRIRLLIVGYLELPDSIKKFDDRIEVYPLHDFVNLQRLMSLVEINIVPLQNNKFTNCKSELKFFEASIVGTLTIASPTFTYKSAINNAKNGFISNDYEWSEVLSKAMDTLENGEYEQMIRKAHSDTLNKYAWYNQKNLLKELMDF